MGDVIASENSPYTCRTMQRVKVLDSHLTYVDTGPASKNDVLLFLHGNPTSSYLWRNVISLVSPRARCIAPDLTGMGQSGKPSNCSYRFQDHARYLREFIAAVLPSQELILVLHDWGSALGLDFAQENPERITGLVLMEFIRPCPTWDDFTADADMRELFRAFRSPDSGRKLLIDENAFIEIVLQAGTARTLTEEDMHAYRLPFRDTQSREPLYRFPNELPIENFPKDVYDVAERYHKWLLQSPVQKLLFWARPGGVISERQAMWYRDNLWNVRSVFVGEGRHYLPEDQPETIGKEIVSWLKDRTF